MKDMMPLVLIEALKEDFRAHLSEHHLQTHRERETEIRKLLDVVERAMNRTGTLPERKP